MIPVLNQFKNDTKKVENYQRNILILEKLEKNRENNNNNEFDEVKELLKNELKNQRRLYMEQNNGSNEKEKRNNNNQFKRRKFHQRYLSLSPSPKSKNNFYIINSHFFNNNNDNINSDNKSQCLSFNLSSNINNNTRRMRCASVSVKNSRYDFNKEISSKIGILYSTINKKEKYANHTNNNNLHKEKISNLLNDKTNYNFDKKNKIYIKRSRTVSMKMKKLKENKDIIRKRHFKLKNFLNKEDFFY